MILCKRLEKNFLLPTDLSLTRCAIFNLLIDKKEKSLAYIYIYISIDKRRYPVNKKINNKQIDSQTFS